jgi:hypothetical protein
MRVRCAVSSGARVILTTRCHREIVVAPLPVRCKRLHTLSRTASAVHVCGSPASRYVACRDVHPPPFRFALSCVPLPPQCPRRDHVYTVTLLNKFALLHHLFECFIARIHGANESWTARGRDQCYVAGRPCDARQAGPVIPRWIFR